MSYDGLVDGDTFDGGDGQTGCVGDGENNLDKFETNGVVQSKVQTGRRKQEPRADIHAGPVFPVSCIACMRPTHLASLSHMVISVGHVA